MSDGDDVKPSKKHKSAKSHGSDEDIVSSLESTADAAGTASVASTSDTSIATTGAFSFNFGADPTPQDSSSAPSTALRSLFSVYTDSDLAAFTFTQGQAPKGTSGVVKAMADNMSKALEQHNVRATDLLEAESATADATASASPFSFGFSIDDNAGVQATSTEAPAKLSSLFTAPSSRTQHADLRAPQQNLEPIPTGPVVDLKVVSNDYSSRQTAALKKLLMCIDEGCSIPTSFCHIMKRGVPELELRNTHNTTKSVIRFCFTSQSRGAKKSKDYNKTKW
jgi:hypothetical protein